MPDENTAGRVWQVPDGMLSNRVISQTPINWNDVAPRREGAAQVATGVKHDGDKPRMELLDPLALEGLAQVLTFGAKKYAAHNWRGGISYSRLLAAALRHITTFNRGEDFDPESGLSHIDHAACCLMFLSHFVKTRKDLDDRYKPDPQ